MFAWRTPTICCDETPAAASLSGSSVTRTLLLEAAGQVGAWRRPRWPRIVGHDLGPGDAAATSSRPSSLVAAIDAMIDRRGVDVERRRPCGSTFAGQAGLARCSPRSSALVSLTSVPNENWATTSAIEFAEVDWSVSSRGTPEMARSIGLATCSATSEAPAPGYGATTVMTGNSMSGRSSCLRLPQAEMPAMNSAPASSSVTLRLADGELGEAAHRDDSFRGTSASRRQGFDRPVEVVDGANDVESLVAGHAVEQPAQLRGVELAEALEELERGRRGGDDDLAPVGGIVAANDEALLDEPIDVAAHRRQGDAETADELGHLHLALVASRHTGSWPATW